MTGLHQIRRAVLDALTAAGIRAVAAYGGSAGQYAGPVVCVDVAESAGKPMALGGYLGEVYDAAAGTTREVYGRQLDTALCLEVRAIGAAACEETFEAVSDALEHGALPSGLRTGEQSWEAVCWDAANQMFLRRGRICCRAWFTAGTDPDTGEVRDFILKGVLTT